MIGDDGAGNQQVTDWEAAKVPVSDHRTGGPIITVRYHHMAWIFELEADCVKKEAAEAFGSHFSGLVYVLPDGRECRVDPSGVRGFEDPVHHFRCCVAPTGASLTGYKDVLRTDDERKQLALFLYERLRTAPPFRFAAVGVECHEFDPFDRNGALDPFDGLVICEQMFDGAGRHREFQPFSPGRFWIPFTETSPL
jgi:hypothetical protein